MNVLRVLIVLVFAGIAALTTTWYWRSRPERAIIGAPRTGEILIDDFGFSIQSSRDVETLGAPEHRVAAHGRFKIVNVLVNNHARRVDFRFEPRIARLVAADGTQFEVSREGQAALEAGSTRSPSHSTPIHAGESCETEVVFDVPANAGPFTFRVCFAGGVFDALDIVMFGNQQIRIE